MNDPVTAKQHNAQQGVGECEIREFIHRDDAHLADKVSEAMKLAIKKALFKFEPKTGLETGVWFQGEQAEACWGYRGALSVVIQFAKPSPNDQTASEPMVVSRCPACERKTLMDRFPSRKVKRWMILPP